MNVVLPMSAKIQLIRKETTLHVSMYEIANFIAVEYEHASQLPIPEHFEPPDEAALYHLVQDCYQARQRIRKHLAEGL